MGPDSRAIRVKLRVNILGEEGDQLRKGRMFKGGKNRKGTLREDKGRVYIKGGKRRQGREQGLNRERETLEL